jgi:hypothetical protein
MDLPPKIIVLDPIAEVAQILAAGCERIAAQAHELEDRTVVAVQFGHYRAWRHRSAIG